MASIVLVDATDMKEYVIYLDPEDANRAATGKFSFFKALVFVGIPFKVGDIMWWS